ncbi:hypothetical protein ACKKBG_A08280 [Auxenochlorella protothecoides x Auxenochlorella symbiontica]
MRNHQQKQARNGGRGSKALPLASARSQLPVLTTVQEPVAGLAEVEDPQCRICWGGSDLEPGGRLLTPCQCRGSVAHVHERCLSEWLNQALLVKPPHQAYSCDLCQAPYHATRSAFLPQLPPLRLPFQGLARELTRPRPGPPLLALWSTAVNAVALGAALDGAQRAMRAAPVEALAARGRPLAALGALGPRLAVAALAEGGVARPGTFHTQLATVYALAWLADAAAGRAARALAAARAAQAGGALGFAALGALRGALAVVSRGSALQQAACLCLMSGLWGGAQGYARMLGAGLSLPGRCLGALALGVRLLRLALARRR